MFGNDFKIMLRNLLKNKVFSIINLLGLATGMAVCILLTLYIKHELGYDNFHERGDRIVRLSLERKYPARSAWRAGIPLGIAAVVKKEFPEVQQYTRVANLDPIVGMPVTVGDRSFKEKNALGVDSTFFQVFSARFLEGDIHTALDKPNAVVLNETTAKKYFGSAHNAIGKQIRTYGNFNWTVTGVCEDWPEKTQIPFSMLISTAGDSYWKKPEYVYFGPATWLLLAPNANAERLEAKLPLMVDKYVAPVVPGLFGESWAQFLAEGNGYRYFLQRITDIHLNSIAEDEFVPPGSMRIVILLGVIAAFILALAGVNFVNLSTALAVQRSREVGIRKTFGSRRYQLTLQFLGESIFFSLVSVLFALLLAALLTPLLNNLSGLQLHFMDTLHPQFLLSVLGFAILVGMLAGLYPALTLSSYDPVTVLKGQFKSSRRGIAFRNGLVIFQFSISVILIICTLVVNRQMHYMLGDNLGFKRDHIISVDALWRLRTPGHENREAFVNEIARIPGVTTISKCSELPGDDEAAGGSTWVTVDNNASRTDRLLEVDETYFKLLGLQFTQGRAFSPERSTDSLGVILNETAVADFGLKNPIGARLISKEPFMNPEDGKSQTIYTVIGVLKDYHYQSLRKKIAPLIIVNSNKFGWGSAGVSISGGQFHEAIAGMEGVWKKFAPKEDFQYRFLDQNLAAQYHAEETQQKLFTIFSGLAIFIGCIGLFGLSAFTIRQRLKEISIRKVLGAMPSNIILIISKDFLLLVGISSLIAFPVAGWAMHTWLQNFAYRTGLAWWIFVLAGALAVGIAMLTISFQAFKAAMTNPVKNLKAE